MKTLSAFVVVALLGSVSAFACEGDEAEAAESGAGKPSLTLVKSEAGDAGASKVTFKVKGMMCRGCEKGITASLKKVEGVKAVSFGKKGKDGVRLAVVTYDGKVGSEQLLGAVKAAGYEAAAQ